MQAIKELLVAECRKNLILSKDKTRVQYKTKERKKNKEMPPNFQNGKIYAIRSHQTDKVYIGSTTQPLSVRFGEHKRMNCSSREIMKFEDCYIELLEEFACENKMQLNRREGE